MHRSRPNPKCRHIGLARITAIILTGAGFAEEPDPTSRQNSQLAQYIGPGASVYLSEHFEIAHDVPPSDLKPLTARLDGTYKAIARFVNHCGFSTEVQKPRLQILLFDSHDAFARHAAGLGVDAGPIAGFYDQNTHIAVFCNARDHFEIRQLDEQIVNLTQRLTPGETPPRGLSPPLNSAVADQLLSLRKMRDVLIERYNRVTIQHEAAHQVLFHFGVHARGASNPLWLAEGLATQFEVPQTNPQGRITNVNQLRLADFRDAAGNLSGMTKVKDEDIDSLFRSGRLIELEAFINDRDFNRSDDQVALRYAQAWALVHFLLREEPEAFSRYLQILSKQDPGMPERSTETADFQACFGPPNPALQRRFVRSILRLRFDPTR